MNFLKGLVLSLLSFLLFLSPSLFGPTLILKKTILNPDFVVSELNKIDVAPLGGELISIPSLPEKPYRTEVINETIAELEPWIKENISAVIYTSYDYLLGRTQSLNVTLLANQWGTHYEKTFGRLS